MFRASEYYPSLIALVNHSLRFFPAFVHMKKALNENIIGQISVIDVNIKFSSLLHENYDWLCSQEMGGGVVNLIGSHVIDLIHYLTGRKALRVHAIVRTFKNQTETISGIRQITAPDFCNFQMELEGGVLVIANLQSNQCCRSAFEQDVAVIGEEGKLIVTGIGDLICLKKKGNDSTGEFKEDKLFVEIQGMMKMVGALKEAFATSTGWKKEAVSSAANFHDALYVQAVIEAIKKSSESRNWIKINMQDVQN
jgi:predicted dehydrogenase